MAKKLDIKQLVLERGERIALIGCGVLMLILLVTNLFMPGSGMFSGNPDEKAQALVSKTQAVNQRLNDPNNKPGPNDLPPKSDDKLKALDMKAIEADKYRLAMLIPVDGGGELGRRLPRIFNVGEAVARFSHVQVQSYMIEQTNPPRIYGVKFENATATAPGGKDSAMPGAGSRNRLSKLFGGRGGLGGMPPPGGMAGMPKIGMPPAVRPPDGGAGGGTDKRRGTLVPILLTELEKRSEPLAEQLQPLRTVVLAASFPYKQQLEEFRSRLGLKSVAEVLQEASTELTPEKQLQPNFRFLGVAIQRRELDGDGKPVGEFKDLDLNAHYRPWLVQTGRRFEPDPPELVSVMVPGLVMPRLMQFREENITKTATTTPGSTTGPAFGGGERGMPDKDKAKTPTTSRDQYPAVEKELASIKTTLESLKGKEPTQIAALPQRFSGDNFDIWSVKPEADKTGGMTGSMPMPIPPPGGRIPMPGSTPPGSGDTTQQQQVELPEHVLVRLIDIDVKPGKTYEYRLKIRMANPNYGRKDLASTTYGEKKELESAEWSKSPIVVHVPSETHLYAVDQRTVDLKADPRGRYRGPYATRIINPDKEIVLQAHMWRDSVPFGTTSLLIGDWLVAERIPVARGEYVGRRERTEVPFWDCTLEAFTIANSATNTKVRQGIPVLFGANGKPEQPEAILVDFTPSKSQYEKVVKRTEDKVETRRVADDFAGDALILTPNGQLQLLESARDVDDEGRKSRVEDFRRRINEARGKDGGGSGGGTNPFGS